MNIALLSEKYPPDPGGLAISAQRLAQLLSGKCQQVHVFAPTNQLAPGLASSGLDEGILIHRFGASSRVDETLANWFDLIILQHKQNQFELLHGYFITQAGFLAAYCGQFCHLPSVISARGNDLDLAVFEPRKAAHIFFAMQHASAITANSRELQRKAQALAPAREVFYVANGVDASHFCPLPRDQELAASLGLPEDKSVIAFVGEARHKKGLAQLLLAYRELAVRHPATLWLLGGVRAGEDREMVKVFRKQNPTLPLVISEPAPAHLLPAYYSLVDVLALPSLRDGLPNALLEGMACGCAIVAGQAGGIPDALQHQHNGLLVPPGEVSALANALQELIDQPELRRTLGENARQHVQQHFTPQQELAATLEVYGKVGVFKG